MNNWCNDKFHQNTNKGFSLVELIIVIAIMAILAGALAPALIKYVQKTRRVADVEAGQKIHDAMEYLLIDFTDPNFTKSWAENGVDYNSLLTGFSWNYTAQMPSGQPNSTWSTRDYLFYQLGEVPVSKVDKHLYFAVTIGQVVQGNPGIEKIMLLEDPFNGTGRRYDLWPADEDWIATGCQAND